MKQNRLLQGFTLIELLVVIAIIAILAGILLPTVIGAFKKVSKSQAQTEVKSLETAIKQYVAEYGKFPFDSGASPDRIYGKAGGFGTADNADMLRVLRAINGAGNINHVNNPRRIVFLEINESSIATNNFVDPWGDQYLVAVDTDFDTAVAINGAGLTQIDGRNVAVFSLGESQTAGSNFTNNYITSWK